MDRSQFILDEGYHFVFYLSDRGIEFENSRSGTLGVGFRIDSSEVLKLSDIAGPPVITVSYSDVVRFHYYPTKDLRVDETFLVYSSRIAVEDITVRNVGSKDLSIEVMPFITAASAENFHKIEHRGKHNWVSFSHREPADGWTIEHNIPYVESVTDVLMQTGSPDVFAEFDGGLSKDSVVSDDSAKTIAFNTSVHLAPGNLFHFRIARGVEPSGKNTKDLLTQIREVLQTNLDRFIGVDERIYSSVPRIRFKDADDEMLYWSGFSLLRQVMMPPEGKCHYNYYVFSREPQWGWGHGGEVFHESLSMLAYVFMDPKSAMGSQLVYVERQHRDGFINYRTGPYLDETIPYDSQLTTSAPWFSWENLGIYSVTRDRRFLSEAYKAGSRFYHYWPTNRDSLRDGLCEWGGHAVLESVRDDQVAVWDKVGWPSNFEGPDLNSMLVEEARSLSKMAAILGRPREAERWNREAAARAELVNHLMWDSTTSFYYNVDSKNKMFTFNNRDDLKREEIIGFLPLWAGIPDSMRAAKLISVLTDTSKFWRRYGVPSLASDDPYYNPKGYWNGPVWVEWNFLIEQGLIRYGYKKLAGDLVEKVSNGMIAQLEKDHRMWEFYDPDQAWAGYHTAYIWAGLISRMLMDRYK